MAVWPNWKKWKNTCWSLTNLELPEYVDEYAAVEGGLAVDGGDLAGDLLEGERGHLLHDLGGALHLLTLERHQGHLSLQR